MDILSILHERMPPFSKLLGIRFLSASPEQVTAEMMVREELCTTPAVLHGGAIMAFADTLGACATVLNLPQGAGTTTIESKTNFLAPAPIGTKAIGECSAVHRDREQATELIALAPCHLFPVTCHLFRFNDRNSIQTA